MYSVCCFKVANLAKNIVKYTRYLKTIKSVVVSDGLLQYTERRCCCRDIMEGKLLISACC